MCAEATGQATDSYMMGTMRCLLFHCLLLDQRPTVAYKADAELPISSVLGSTVVVSVALVDTVRKRAGLSELDRGCCGAASV